MDSAQSNLFSYPHPTFARFLRWYFAFCLVLTGSLARLPSCLSTRRFISCVESEESSTVGDGEEDRFGVFLHKFGVLICSIGYWKRCFWS